MERPASEVPARVVEFLGNETKTRSDRLATEEPLEIRLRAAGKRRTVAITMRTPGHDFELAAGFLYSEGVIAAPADIARISYCTDPDVDAQQQFNIVNVHLRAGALPDLGGLDRHFLTSSSCGVCGKATLEALEIRGCPTVAEGPEVDPTMLASLPNRLRAAQGLFDHTGGLHAAGVFDASGELVAAREDVGRHNAVDKLIGRALLEDRLPLSHRIGLVSGRASYEIVQKFLVAGCPVVCAVSAPSSLAVAVAERFGMTLVGFLRGQRFNVYAGVGRVRVPAAGGLVIKD